ncbi:MAG TPA: Gfo/Idh/MocA family oxidoreductase [Bryobacteraceae bacterium]|jgi:predicted dehydrogenase|nr:Gfo/Idh/MocA family oxidoreductase [Bryobacteraceae bacterium]
MKIQFAKFAFVFLLLSMRGVALAADTGQPLRVAIIGLVHGHVGGFMKGGALAPAGGALNRGDVQIVGVIEPEQALFDSYAKQYHWDAALHFKNLPDLVAAAHPNAALVFTSTAGHLQAVEECARAGIHVMMEKPLAVSYRDALAMVKAANQNHIHVLVDYETSWYASNNAAGNLLAQGALGPIVKTVVRDGHEGPTKIHVQPEFFTWLTDPKLNGAGALYDFGCYGADLMTWLMKGEAPVSVTATTAQLQPDLYPKVDDEADVLLNYKHAVAILQGSWNWPFAVKQMDVYGQTGYAKTIDSRQIEIRRKGESHARISDAAGLSAPYDDPLHYLASVIRDEVQEGDSVSSLKTNVLVSEILDAARQSARTGKTVTLPLRGDGQ